MGDQALRVECPWEPLGKCYLGKGPPEGMTRGICSSPAGHACAELPGAPFLVQGVC